MEKGIYNSQKAINIALGKKISSIRGETTREKFCLILHNAAAAPTDTDGEKLSLNPDTLKQWEYGNNAVSLQWIPAICEVGNCEYDYFFGSIESKTHTVTDIRAETGLSSEAIEVLQALKRYRLDYVLRLISEMIVFNANNPLYGENEILLFQALSNLLHLIKLGIDSEAANRGNIVLMQDLFMDFIKDQLRQPLPDPEA